MKILLLTEALPYPLTSRSRLRAYYLLRYLAQEHEVRLVSFVGEETRPEHVAHLGELCREVLTVPNPHRPVDLGGWLQSVLTGRPAGVMHGEAAGMEAVLARLMVEDPPEVVQAEQITMARYALAAARAYSGEDRGPRLVLDVMRAMHRPVAMRGEAEMGAARLFWQREARLYRQYEARLLRRFDRVLTMTADDKGALLHLLPEELAAEMDERITVLPMAVDAQGTPPVVEEERGPHILFLSNFRWPPAEEGVVWFVQRVLPGVLKEVPEAHFTIVGREPPVAVEALGAAEARLGAHVEVTGFVPDAGPYWARSRVFVVPLLRAEGMQVKVLDAWLRGVPVVATSAGVQGIAIRPGQTNLLADEAEEFAAAVVALLERPEMRRGLARNARDWVEQRYDWRVLYRELDAVYEVRG